MLKIKCIIISVGSERRYKAMQTAVILISVAIFGAAFYLLLKDRFWVGMFLSILPAVLAGTALDSGLSASSSKSQSPC